MHGLEDQAAVLALDVDDALGAQDVLALLAQQTVEPGGEFGPVHGAVEGQGDALDVVLVGVAPRSRGLGAVGMVVAVVVTLMAVAMAVIVVVVAAVFVVDVAGLAVGGVGELGIDVEDPAESKPPRPGPGPAGHWRARRG